MFFSFSGYSNDSPYMVEPEVQNIRVKNGTQFTLKCHHKGVTWEYRVSAISILICVLHTTTTQ